MYTQPLQQTPLELGALGPVREQRTHEPLCRSFILLFLVAAKRFEATRRSPFCFSFSKNLIFVEKSSARALPQRTFNQIQGWPFRLTLYHHLLLSRFYLLTWASNWRPRIAECFERLQFLRISICSFKFIYFYFNLCFHFDPTCSSYFFVTNDDMPKMLGPLCVELTKVKSTKVHLLSSILLSKIEQAYNYDKR